MLAGSTAFIQSRNSSSFVFAHTYFYPPPLTFKKAHASICPVKTTIIKYTSHNGPINVANTGRKSRLQAAADNPLNNIQLFGKISAQTMDKSGPTRMLSEKANTPSLRISIASRPTTPEVRDSEETAAMGSLPDDENISLKDGTSSSSSSSSTTTAFGLDKNVRMDAGDNETKKAQMRVISFSELCNSPPTNFTVPTSPPPRAYNLWYDSDDDQAEEPAPPANLSADYSGLDNNKNVEMKDRDNNETKKGQMPVTTSLSELCNSPLPTKSTVPTSTSPLPLPPSGL